MEWISVKERLPEKKYSLKYLLVIVSGKIKIGTYDKSRDFWIFTTTNYAYTNQGVTHWMPLPEPPIK